MTMALVMMMTLSKKKIKAPMMMPTTRVMTTIRMLTTAVAVMLIAVSCWVLSGRSNRIVSYGHYPHCNGWISKHTTWLMGLPWCGNVKHMIATMEFPLPISHVYTTFAKLSGWIHENLPDIPVGFTRGEMDLSWNWLRHTPEMAMFNSDWAQVPQKSDADLPKSPVVMWFTEP